MSYVPSISAHSGVQASIIKAGTPTSVAVGGRFSLSGSISGNASISSDRVTLSPNFSYYLEGSILVQNTSGSKGEVAWQWYDNTNSVYLGAEGYMNLATSFGATARISRRVASALILSSDMSASIDVELRIKTLTGSGWNMTITATGISTFNYVGYPSIRVLELAS